MALAGPRVGHGHDDGHANPRDPDGVAVGLQSLPASALDIKLPSGQATESHNMMIAEKSGDSAPAMHGSFLKIHG